MHHKHKYIIIINTSITFWCDLRLIMLEQPSLTDHVQLLCKQRTCQDPPSQWIASDAKSNNFPMQTNQSTIHLH